MREDRIKAWLNAPEHWTGNHKNYYHCPKSKRVGRPKKGDVNTSVWKVIYIHKTFFKYLLSINNA